MNLIKKVDVYKIMIFIIIVFVSIPSLNIFKMYDTVDLPFHIKRTDGLVCAINNFSYPYRINSVANLSYGGAEPIMYPYLFMFIPAIFYKIFNEYAVSFNLFYIIINIFTAIIMFYSTKKIFNNKIVAYISVILILLSYYRVELLYGAGAIGEVLAMMVKPLIACGYIEILRKEKNGVRDFSIALTMLLQSHIISIFYTAILLVIISIILIKKIIFNKEVLFAFLKSIFIFLCLNMWFIIPFLDYYFNAKIVMPMTGFDYVLANAMDIKDQILFPIKLFMSLWTIGNIFHHRQFSFDFAIIILFILLYFIVNRIYKSKRKLNINNNFGEHIKYNDDKCISYINICFILIFVLSIFESCGIFTRCIFGKINFLQKIFIMQQLETRSIGRALPLFYMSVAFFIFNLSTMIFNKKNEFDNKKINKVFSDNGIIVLLFLLIVISILPLIRIYAKILPNVDRISNYMDFANSDYIPDKAIVGNKDIRELVKVTYNLSLPKNIFDKKFKSSDNVIVSNIKEGYLSYSFDYKVRNDYEKKIEKNQTYVDVPLFNYMGYVAKNKKGKNYKIRDGNNKTIRIIINDESGSIKVYFTEKTLWLVFDILFLFTIIFLFVSLCKKNLINKNL